MMKTKRKVFDRYLTRAEERKLFAEVRQFSSILAKRDYEWMGLMRRTGIRVGTMAGLTVGDAERALVAHTLTLRDEICKKGQGYEVPLTKPAANNLKALLRIRRQMGHVHDVTAPLVMSRHHQGMSVRSYQDRMKHWRELAHLPSKVSPHWFRHTVAKRIMTESTSSDPRGMVMSALGHSSIHSTVIYTQPDKESVRLALEEAM